MSDGPNHPSSGDPTPGGRPPGEPQGGPPPGGPAPAQPQGGPPPAQPQGGQPAAQPQGGPPPAPGGPPPAQGYPPPAQGYPPSAPQAPQATSGIGEPADLVTRFLARLIDMIILGVVYFIIVVTVFFSLLFSANVGGMGGFGGFGFSGPAFISSIIGSLLYIGYFAYLESNRGQTLGKMVLKIQVRGPDGRNPTMEQALKRNAWLLLPIIPFVGWLAQLVVMIIIAVTINSNLPSRQGWHDDFAGGTSVIKIG